jgi:hypothetical protein
MTDWKAIERILGETVREIGILVLVFAPLDAAFAEGSIDFRLVIPVVGWAILAIIARILLETGD